MSAVQRAARSLPTRAAATTGSRPPRPCRSSCCATPRWSVCGRPCATPSTTCPSTAAGSTRLGLAPDDLNCQATPATCRSPRRSTCATTTRSACSPCLASELVRVHASSGTTGNPTTVGYTAGDVALWADLIARTLARRRHAARRHAAERLRLRPVHRRSRPALRLRAAGRHHPADLRRQHRPPAQAHARLRRHGPLVHAVVCPLPRRSGARPRPAARRPADQGRLPRRRALEQRDAPRRSKTASASRRSTSTASPRWAARRGLRVPLQGRHARERRPLPGRDRRPGNPRAGARGHGRRARHHDAQPGGAAAHPLPHPRPLQPRVRALRVRPHRSPA